MRFFLFSKLLSFPTFSCENLVTESQRCLPECLHWNAESLSLLPSFLLVIISLLTVYHLLFLTTVSVVPGKRLRKEKKRLFTANNHLLL